ncbi:F-box protein PP2-B11-like isoform X3 [Rhododendron vialii]|uniref:F-box protein PP2-B11-like isoform X3 n=1 Tax=Rhododendron vialii TaxID=182163 RepID=UPI00265F6B1F|nr:F-box protein PP2-B11-like isoform X3 [Rhododendron vialii]
MDNFSVLPEGCISQILSMTSPRDACRSSAISSGFDAAANSDPVWEKFLPSDYRQIISRSVSPVVFSTKKQLYFSLFDSPLLLDGGKLSFALDRESGKKCYTLPAREVAIAWKEDSRYWKWISLPEFPEVAQLLFVCWLDIWGRINTAMLSTNITYAAYLIFKIADRCGLEYPVKSSVRFVKELEDGYQDDMSFTVYLTLETVRYLPREQNGRLPQMRRDGRMEIELGEFYDDKGDEGEVEMRLREVRVGKSRLIVEGIEVRPKDTA